jgi:hypothetical protein
MTRRPDANVMRLRRAFQAEVRAFPKEALISAAAFLQSTAISARTALVDAGVNAIYPTRYSGRHLRKLLDILATKCYEFPI